MTILEALRTVTEAIKVWSDNKFAIAPKVGTITLSSSAWTGADDEWSQTVTGLTVTARTKVDLQPTAEQVVELGDACIALMMENNNGTLTCHAVGNKPTKDYVIQVTLQEMTAV